MFAKMINELEFHEEEHIYSLNGKIVTNVTRVLSPLVSFHMVDPVKLENARRKGVAVHKMVELWCQDDLDEASLPEWMVPVLDQWKLFVEMTKFRVLESESRVYHKVFGYAGTLDLFGIINEKDHAIIDLKRSFAAGDVIGYQTAAYAEAHENKKCKRFALKLREDGHFKLKEYKDKNDFTHFLTCLNWHRLQEKHRGK